VIGQMALESRRAKLAATSNPNANEKKRKI
jgi:hypothetical protein